MLASVFYCMRYFEANMNCGGGVSVVRVETNVAMLHLRLAIPLIK